MVRTVAYYHHGYILIRIIVPALENAEGESAADRIISKTVPLGQRFYPSDSAFPIREFSASIPFAVRLKLSVFHSGHVASLLVRFALANKDVVPYGWASRILVQCGVPYGEIWDLLHEMYESQACHSVDICRTTSKIPAVLDTPVQRAEQRTGDIIGHCCTSQRLARRGAAANVVDAG